MLQQIDRVAKGDDSLQRVNDFVVKSCALALLRVPEVNASWTENAILRHKHADIGVAVALDFGLITPIVFAAEGKGLGHRFLRHITRSRVLVVLVELDPAPVFEMVAESCGGRGERVETSEQLMPALRRSFDALRSGTPALLNVTTQNRDVNSWHAAG